MEDRRNRVLEPPEGIPAKNMPVLVPFLDRTSVTGGTVAFTAGLIAALGAMLLFTGKYGTAVPVVLLVFATPTSLYCGLITIAGSLPMRKLTGEPFRLVSGLDGAVAAGARVSVPLDGRWFVTRLPAPLRAQLAAQRRLWTLGPFCMLPGSIVPRRGKFRAAPAKGSTPFLVEPASPGKLVRLQRRLLAFHYFLGAGITLVVAFLALWITFDLPDRGNVLVPSSLALAVACGLAAIGLTVTGLLLLRPIPEPRWTELFVVSGPASVNLFGMVTVTGRTVLPDGREVSVRAGGSDPSLAANIAATGRLWVLGVPVAGKVAKAGVPGHAVFGPVKFGR
ncbi:hypothetical protein [Amycolatopsis orientalis]|uniref:hypothetical protein n=1 Tax=Amycolatopsis orientalis TaxID=31958 RepID=UPI0004195328|nr:hypothetical protein [Amycolatopsis orientalis]